MKLYKIIQGILLEDEGKIFLLEEDWDILVNTASLYSHLKQQQTPERLLAPALAAELMEQDLLAPIGTQEVWAAGVTYLRSRDARMEESQEAGGATFYDKVYEAERPELFFKSLPHRVAGSGHLVYIREDSTWNVPEPELTLFINSSGSIQGYTVGNDMSSRSIEGENPLYLPQAKVYERSAALGPCLYVPEQPIDPEAEIRMIIRRDEQICFEDHVPLSRMKRSLPELAGWLYKSTDFPQGCFLMTGTCIVPGNDFTLQEDDVVEISISGIGLLRNGVAFYRKPAK